MNRIRTFGIFILALFKIVSKIVYHQIFNHQLLKRKFLSVPSNTILKGKIFKGFVDADLSLKIKILKFSFNIKIISKRACTSKVNS